MAKLTSDRNYIYIGEIANNQNYDFDVDKYNSLVANRNYTAAAKYAEQYIPTNPEDTKTWFEELNRLKSNGYEIDSAYSTIQDDQNLLEAVEVADSWKDISMLYALNNEAEQKTNSRARNLLNSYANFGGENAAYIGITFHPEQRKLLGIDWLAKDNEITIEKFYELSGLNEEQLLNAGVSVEKDKTGKTTIKFDKANPIGLQIIKNIPTVYSSVIPFVPNQVSNVQGFASYDGPSAYERLNPIAASNRYATISLFNSNGKDITKDNYTATPGKDYRDFYYLQIANIKKQIQEAEEMRQNHFDKLSATTQLHESIIFGNINDYQQTLEDRFNKGELTQSEYYQQLTELNKEMHTIFSTIDSTMPMYSAAFRDDNISDLVELDNKQRYEIAKQLANATQDDSNHRIKYGLMQSGGEIGMYITLLPKEKDSKGELRWLSHSFGSNTDEKPISVFIPGLFTKQMEEEMKSDPTFHTNKIISFMSVNGSDYTTNDGTKIKSIKIDDSETLFEINGEVVDKNTAFGLIYKDKAIQEAQQSFYLNSLGADGSFINTDEYFMNAIDYTIEHIIPKIYPQYNITRGISDYNSINIRNHNYKITDILNGTLPEMPQFEEFKVIQEIRDIFNQIMVPAKTRAQLEKSGIYKNNN